MNGWMSEWKNNLNSVSGCFTGLSLSQAVSQRSQPMIPCLLTVSARKHSKKMTLARALPANGLSAASRRLVSGIKTGLTWNWIEARALGREGGGTASISIVPHYGHTPRGSISPMGSGGLWYTLHWADMCVQRELALKGLWSLSFAQCENTEEGDTKCKKKKKFNKTLVSKVWTWLHIRTKVNQFNTLAPRTHEINHSPLLVFRHEEGEKNPQYL